MNINTEECVKWETISDSRSKTSTDVHTMTLCRDDTVSPNRAMENHIATLLQTDGHRHAYTCVRTSVAI